VDVNVTVRVIAAGQDAISVLDNLCAGTMGDTQDGIGVTGIDVRDISPVKVK
jgi:hypothetical protein